MNKFYLILLNIIFVTSSLFAENKKEESNKLKYALIISAGTLSAGVLSYLTFQHFKRKHKPTTTEKFVNLLNKADEEFPKLHAATTLAVNLEADKNTVEDIEESVKSNVERLEEAVKEIKHNITDTLDLASSIKDPKLFEYPSSQPGSPKINPNFDYLNLDYHQDPPRRK